MKQFPSALNLSKKLSGEGKCNRILLLCITVAGPELEFFLRGELVYQVFKMGQVNTLNRYFKNSSTLYIKTFIKFELCEDWGSRLAPVMF